MKALGPVLAVIGLVVGVIALLNSFVLNHSLFKAGSHMSLYAGIIGAVLVVVGVVVVMMGRKAAA